MIKISSGMTGRKLARKLGIEQPKPKKQSEADYNTVQWKNLRKKVLVRDRNKCRNCGCNENLQCHHLYYVVGRLRYEYPITALKILCKSCHNKFHKKTPGSKMVISEKEAYKRENKKAKSKGVTKYPKRNLGKELNDRFKFLISSDD